jgi:hypothetical protein
VSSSIKVTVEGTEGLSHHTILGFWPETQQEFDAIVERVGGPGVFDRFGETYASAHLDGGVNVQLNAPTTERRERRVRVSSWAIQALADAKDGAAV